MTGTPMLSWFGIVRLGLVQTGLGAVVVLTTSTLNRVMVVELALPGRPPANLGVLLFDPSSDRLESRLRQDPEALADPEDAEVIAELAEDFAMKIRELGGRRFLEYLEDNLSNVLRISARRSGRTG